MNPLRRLLAALRPGPKSAEDLEAEAEGARIRDEIETTRVSTRGGSASENYQSGRGPSR